MNTTIAGNIDRPRGGTTTLSITTFSITAFSIMALSIKGLFVAFSMNNA
jgi:hypothetical protein